MKFAFIFPGDFTPLSVFQKAIGGSESAITYLAIELIRLGHEVTLFTTTQQPQHGFSIRNQSFKIINDNIQFAEAIFKEKFDVIVVKNGLPELARVFRDSLPYNPKILFWTGHAYDQPAIQGLLQEKISSAYDAIICVSNWHKDTMCQQFNLDNDKTQIIRNAIGFAFENMYLDLDEFVATKQQQLTLAYTSTPFRGLELLLNIMPNIEKDNSLLQLNVYSSMQVYGVSNANDEYHELYDKANSIPVVNYYGSQLQSSLAASLRSCHILAYPSIFAETSCIAVMEALASGLYVVTSDLGALPETCLNYGVNVPVDKLSANYKLQLQQAIDRFDDINFIANQYQQVITMNKSHTWRNRAREWVNLITSL